MEDKIKQWYSKRNIRGIKVEFGTFGKFNQYVCKVEYSKNNVNTFTDYLTQSDTNAMTK